MILAVSSFYYIFWFIMSLVAAALAIAAFIYLVILLKRMRDSLLKIEDGLSSCNTMQEDSPETENTQAQKTKKGK